MRLEALVWLVLAAVLVLVPLAEAETGDPHFRYRTKERLRVRVQQASEYVAKGDFEGLLTVRSARSRRDVEQEPPEEIERSRRNLQHVVSVNKPILILVDVQVFGLRARTTMRMSVLEKDGSRRSITVYDYWVFENDDWYLEDIHRSL